MRYCHQCHRITVGEPLFCNFCGSTYNVKLCPSRHINPRSADVCSECGARDLSTPAPRLPFWLAPLLWILAYLPGVLLLILSLFVLSAVVEAFLRDQRLQAQFMVLVLLLGVLWFVYMHIPPLIRGLFKTIWRKAKPKRKDHSH